MNDFIFFGQQGGDFDISVIAKSSPTTLFQRKMSTIARHDIQNDSTISRQLIYLNLPFQGVLS